MHFQQLQHQFANAIRAQQAEQAPAGVTSGQFAVYQELFFNNVLNFVSNAFPVLCSLYSKDAWQQKVSAFYRSASQPSPYFLQIAEQFLQWQAEQPLDAADPAFIAELAHYEWIELALATQIAADELQLSSVQPDSQLQLSALAALLIYQYPVMQISADFQPTQPSPTPHFLLVYRDLLDVVKFVQLNQLSAALLFQVQSEPGIRWSALLDTLRQLFPTITAAKLEEGACEFVQDLANKAVIRAFQGT